MTTVDKQDPPGGTPRVDQPLPRKAGMRLLLGVLCLPCLLFLGYQVENWRGARAWKACQREVERKGSTLDRRKFVPPPVPDELNVFKAPGISEWFNPTNSEGLARRLSADAAFGRPEQGGTLLAEVTVVPLDADPAPATCDVLLDYWPHLLVTLGRGESGEDLGSQVVPLIVMDEVPLGDAIRNLARQADLNYVMDPRIDLASLPSVTVRWENVTVREALGAILANYNLELLEDPRSGIARLTWKTPNSRNIQADCAAQRKVGDLLARSSALEPGGPGVRKLTAATDDFVLFSDNSRDKTRFSPAPIRVFLRAANIPTAEEVEELLQSAACALFPDARRLKVATSRKNTFRAYLYPPRFCRATDYLTLTAQFEPDFNLIHHALQRPMTRMELDYSFNPTSPIPNFITMRRVAQTLAQRAQAHLLLDQPAKALREIRLAQDLCLLLENRPSGKPVLLVPAMMRVAITGLSATTVAQGFQLKCWREPELRELQDLLSRIHLAPAVASAFSFERATLCRTLETCSAGQMAEILTLCAAPLPAPLSEPSRWDTLKSPAYWFVTIAPRGWVYQNMAALALLGSPQVDGYDPKWDRLDPRFLDMSCDDFARLSEDFHPYTWLAATAAPNFMRAWQVTAKNQALVDQAFLACALERYRLAYGHYPESLQALVPQFTARLPHDILTGEPPRYRLTGEGGFLLYSVGWDLADDGGKKGEPAGTAGTATEDWVWPGSPPARSLTNAM